MILRLFIRVSINPLNPDILFYLHTFPVSVAAADQRVKNPPLCSPCAESGDVSDTHIFYSNIRWWFILKVSFKWTIFVLYQITGGSLSGAAVSILLSFQLTHFPLASPSIKGLFYLLGRILLCSIFLSSTIDTHLFPDLRLCNGFINGRRHGRGCLLSAMPQLMH